MLLRVFIVLALVAPGSVWAATWRLDPGTTVAVDVPWTGGVAEVRFPRLSGTIEFDERRPETAKARIGVSAGAAETGLGLVDALVRSRDYLDTAQFPEITFELERLTRTSAQTADVAGRITLRGVTRPVEFKARVVRYAPMKDDPDRFEAGFDLETTIDRTEFGSLGGVPQIAAVLPVRIRLLMTSQ